MSSLICVGGDHQWLVFRNAALLRERWAPGLSAIDSTTLSGRDHFDALDELADPHGRLYVDALELLGIPLSHAAVGR